MRKYSNWYERNIEPKIRELVYQLRNNGFNTTCSCEEEMYIECESYDPTNELYELYDILNKLKIKRYKIEIVVDKKPYQKYKTLIIYLLKENGKYTKM